MSKNAWNGKQRMQHKLQARYNSQYKLLRLISKLEFLPKSVFLEVLRKRATMKWSDLKLKSER